MTYARGTSVAVDKSQAELEKLLLQRGASSFWRGQDGQRAVIGFSLADRQVKFVLPLPQLETYRQQRGGKTYAMGRCEQATKERWRALLLCVKAKLESVEAGIETFEEAFLAHVVTPDRRTVYEHVRDQLADGYSSGKVAPLMLGDGR